MSRSAHLHRVKPGTKIAVRDLDAADTSAAPGDRQETEAATEALARRLAELQEVLWARHQEKVLVVLQGIDTSGKGGTVEHVFGAVNPTGLRAVSFKAPTVAELDRDYLWRVHAQVPAAGEIGVFDRSHYEDVLIARVEGLVPEARWRRRYDHINGFEQMLVDEGTTIVKLLLHISKDEQRERLQARLDQPEKHWKFNPEDLDVRARWADYETAYSEAITRTATAHAPWHVIPADKKWYRNWAVATIMVGVLEGLDLTWPPPSTDLADVVVD
jgi:PPK2 family polyphosphate:nucleotide phosphotransferase